MVIKKILTICFLSCVVFLSGHEVNEKLLNETRIRFSKNTMTVKDALDELSKMPGIFVVYNANETFLGLPVTLSPRNYTIKEALDEIGNQAPVEIMFSNNHIVVKARKLETEYLLKGKVVDALTGEPLIAADIYINGTTRGTVSDVNGDFSMKLAPGNYQIACRYVGYAEEVIPVSLFQDHSFTIRLKTKQHEIKEVNVTGTIGQVEDLDRGRPIEKIEARTINRLNTNDVTDALHGRISGVWTTKISGAPGDHNKVRIRGISSIFGSTDPLYVVDGMIVPVVNFKTLGISDLNTHDVQSITVLKDASSTALYGYLGGNGVIIVETKKGGGKTRFNLDIKQGFQQFTKRYPLMNTKDFLNNMAYSDSLIGTTFYWKFPLQQRWEQYPVYQDSLGNLIGYTDFQDEIFQTGIISEVQLSGQGSYRKVDYFISGNYYTHKGVVVNTNYEKYTLTGNFSRIVGDKFSMRLLYKGSWQENENNLDNYMGNNVIYRGINYEPGYHFTPDSFFNKYERFFLIENISPYGNTFLQLSDCQTSPDLLFHKQSKTKNEYSNSLNLQGSYLFSDQLSFRAAYTLMFKNLLYDSYVPDYNEDYSYFLSSNEHLVIFSQQYELRYERLVNNHSLSAFALYRNYKDNISWLVDSIKQHSYYGITRESNVYLRGSQAIFGSKGSVIRAINSAVANINYSYKKKYSASFIADFDHLKEGFYVNQNEIFSSVALDWDLAKESFLRLPRWIGAFHLYANRGQSGNYPLNSLSNDIYATPTVYSADDSIAAAVYIANLANHYISDEKVTEYNFGSEIRLFNDRLILSGDYYIKHNTDLLIQRTIPYYYGGGYLYQNIGIMNNKGVEVSVEVTPVEKSNFTWTTKIGYTTNNQVVEKLYDSVPISFNNTDILYPDFYAREGEPLGAITGYSYQGLWDEAIHSDEVNGYTKFYKVNGIAILAGDTSSKSFNSRDKVIIGNSIPRFTCNWINLMRYRNFTCEMLWYAVIDVDKYNATKACTYITGTSYEVRDIVMDTMSYHTRSSFYESSYFIEDASFIRLKTLSFRYVQPKKIASKVGIEYSLSFENLLTFTRYSGYDPEATIYTDNNFTDNAIDKGSYPNPQGIYLSINLSF
jgi:TonB-dependent starch-binding outer membrane protein SusC